MRTLKFSVLTFCLRDAHLRPGSGGGHGQGALRGAVSAGRGRLGGAATPVTAIFRSSGRRQCPAASRLTRVSRGSHARPPVVLRLRINRRLSSPSPVLCGLARQGFAGCPCFPLGGQPHTMRHVNTTECALMAIRRKAIPDGRAAGRARAISSGRESRPGRASRTGGRTPGRAHRRRGTCRRSRGQRGAAAGRSRSTGCPAG